MPVETIVRETIAGSVRPDHLIGVEIGPAIIRAGVFTASTRLAGKTKFSTKIERGPEAVIGRVAKCIRYAADECDLSMGRIKAIGVGVLGQVESNTGTVESAPDLAWENVQLCAELERELAIPAFVGNVHNLGTLGIHTQEAKAVPSRIAALFLGPRIGGGVILDGDLCDLSELAPRPLLFETPQLNVFSTMPQAEFRHFRSRDFRKALRKGNPAVVQFFSDMAIRAGQVAAHLIERFDLEVIAIGGGVLDEMREELLQIIQASARKELGAGRQADVSFLPSMMGDLAGVVGAAVWAADHLAMLDEAVSSR